MYSVQLDEHGYFTGAWAEVGGVEGGVPVETLPPDLEKAVCFRRDSAGGWTLDGARWEALREEREAADIRERRAAAFLLIDRYQLALVYAALSSTQQEELAAYRAAWLDAPQTLLIPEPPEWLV